MKKIKKYTFTIVLALLLIFAIAACENINSTDRNNKESNQPASVSSSSVANSNDEGSDKTDTSTKLLPYTYQVPMENIFIDVPNYQEIEEGLTKVFIVQESKYVAITPNWLDKTDNLEEAHDRCYDLFLKNMTNYQGGVNSLSISSTEKKTINGIEMYRYEGSINYGKQNVYDGFALGYYFVIDNIPCEIVGSVIDREQTPELIEEITMLVDQMALTVRTSA